VTDRLLLDFDPFFLEHRQCGDLAGGSRTSARGWCASRAARGSNVSLRSGPRGHARLGSTAHWRHGCRAVGAEGVVRWLAQHSLIYSTNARGL